MKNAIQYLFVACLLFLISCTYSSKVKCIDRPNTYILFSTGDTSIKMEYTGIAIGRYKAGTNFTVIDSLLLPVSDTDTFRQSYTRIGGSYFTNPFDAYDWIYTFYPSGRQFRIRNVTRHPESKRMNNDRIQDGVKCVNGISYYLNDSLVSIPGEDVGYQQVSEQYIRIRY